MRARNLRSRTASVLAPGCTVLLVGLAASCSSDDTTIGTTGGGAGDGSANGGASGASGSSATGGASGNAGVSAAGGTTDCPPECFVNDRCVAKCGDTPTDYGCCPCPPGTINVLSCGASSGGAGGGSSGGAGGAPSSTGSCDARRVRCKSLPASCPAGQVPSVDGICWGPCVAIDSCTCAAAADCPDSNQYTCYVSQGTCGPYL